MSLLLSRVRLRSWSLPLALLLAAVAAFGVLIPWLGFYWDDWAKILVARLWGLGAYWNYYLEDRPLSSWTHILLTPILGQAPLGWHIFDLLMRWASAAAFWWLLRGIWPKARYLAAGAAFLFLLYPIFTMQAIAVTFHQQWLQYALFLFSLGAMAQAWRQPRRRLLYTALALAASVAQLSVTEYFSPGELIRLLLLWFLAGEGEKRFRNRLALTLKTYAPYAVVMVIYLVYRFVILPRLGVNAYPPVILSSLITDPIPTIKSFAPSAARDALLVIYRTWYRLAILTLPANITPFYLISIAIAFLSGAGIALYLNFDRSLDEGNSPAESRTLLQMVIFGLGATFLGLAPAWATGHLVTEDFHGSRYALPAMYGAALIWAVAVEWLLRNRLQKSIVLAGLAAFAIGFHLQVANDYRWLWTDQLEAYWQLAWRAPYIQPGTALFTEQEPFPNQGLFSTSSALNLLYPQPAGSDRLAYYLYTLRPRYNDGFPQNRTVNFTTRFRSLAFSGSSNRMLVFQNGVTGSNCLWVLDNSYLDNPVLSDLIKSAIPKSDLSLISNDPPARGYPPTDLFGREPAHTWCYYFEKADLARQMGDWTTAAALGDQARKLGYTPSRSASDSPQEWLPFIEAYAHLGRWQDAAQLTLSAYQQDNRYQHEFCQLWSSLSDSGEEGQAVKSDLSCSP